MIIQSLIHLSLVYYMKFIWKYLDNDAKKLGADILYIDISYKGTKIDES